VIDGAFSSIVFGRVAKKLVYRLKYKPFLHNLKDFMTDLFYEGLIQNEDFMRIRQEKALLVPIPLYKAKFNQRGYNQAAYLAQGIGDKFSLPTVDILERVRATSPQSRLHRDERRENIKGAFKIACSDGKNVQGKTLFLVDDVLTSGATLAEAASILKRAGAEKVYGLTLAHGE
jgi:ComF family protein